MALFGILVNSDWIYLSHVKFYGEFENNRHFGRTNDKIAILAIFQDGRHGKRETFNQR